MPELCRLLLLSNFRAISVMKFPGLHSLQHSPPVFSPSDPTDAQSSSFGPLCQGLLFCLWSPQHVPSNFDFKNTGFLLNQKQQDSIFLPCSSMFQLFFMWKMATVDWSYRAALHLDGRSFLHQFADHGFGHFHRSLGPSETRQLLGLLNDTQPDTKRAPPQPLWAAASQLLPGPGSQLHQPFLLGF